MSYKNWMKAKIKHAKDYQYKAFHHINGLIITDRQGKRVKLDDGRWLTEFVSCSYLGLDQDKRLIDKASDNIQTFGITFHSARTRIQPKAHIELEDLLSRIYASAYPVVFPTIHMAHLGLLPLLGSGEMPSFPTAKKGITFLLDNMVHASVQINRGLLEQFGTVLMIDFNDHELIEHEFKAAMKEGRTPIAIADSVGSMGGIAPIQLLLNLAEKYQGYVYLDDAHGTSVHGYHGSGYVLKCLDNSFHPRLILVNSLGKAFAALGGVLLFKHKDDADFTKRFAPTYVFGGPPALSIIDTAIASANIHLTDEIHTLQNTLWDNVRYFDSLLHQHTINTNTPSPVRGILIGDELKAIEFAVALQKRGFAVTTAMYPTVPKGQSILRIALSVAHSKQQIAALCSSINDIHKASSTEFICEPSE